VTSRLEALDALRPYLDAYNAKAKANIKASPPQKGGCRTLSNLIEEWQEDIIPNRKLSGARTSLSHVRTYVAPLLGKKMLRDLTVREHQAFVTAVGQSVGRRRTVQNVYGTLTSILNRGRKWGYFIPEVRKRMSSSLRTKHPNPKRFSLTLTQLAASSTFRRTHSN